MGVSLSIDTNALSEVLDRALAATSKKSMIFFMAQNAKNLNFYIASKMQMVTPKPEEINRAVDYWSKRGNLIIHDDAFEKARKKYTGSKEYEQNPVGDGGIKLIRDNGYKKSVSYTSRNAFFKETRKSEYESIYGNSKKLFKVLYKKRNHSIKRTKTYSLVKSGKKSKNPKNEYTQMSFWDLCVFYERRNRIAGRLSVYILFSDAQSWLNRISSGAQTEKSHSYQTKKFNLNAGYNILEVSYTSFTGIYVHPAFRSNELLDKQTNLKCIQYGITETERDVTEHLRQKMEAALKI